MIAFRTLLLTLVIHAVGLPGISHGQTSEASAMPDRWLLVVDVSSPMKNRADAVRESVQSLLKSGMHGELVDGAELGVWTFNDSLHSGDFPLVTWTPDARDTIATQVDEFLAERRYRQQTDFSLVAPHLVEVMANSRRLTVILYSDGDEAIVGTPFDRAIQAYFAEHREMLKEEQIPFVTVLRGYKGRLVGHSKSYPPWPVELPEFPAEPEPAPTTSSSAQTTANQPDLSRTLVTKKSGPIVFAEPLVVTGNTRRAKAPAPVTPPTDPSLTAAGQTNDAAPPASTDGSPNRQAASPSDVVPTESTSKDQPSRVWVGGIALVAGLGIGYMIGRARARPRRSLITESMDRKRPRR